MTRLQEKNPKIESCYGGDKSAREGGDDGDIPDYDEDSDDEAKMPKELYEIYCKQLEESECFDVIDVGEYLWFGMVKLAILPLLWQRRQ